MGRKNDGGGRGRVHLLRNVVPRILAQGLLTLTGFLISVTAAHQLTTAALACFFIAWTLESLWVGAVRTVAVPAILLNQQTTPVIPLIGVAFTAAIPLVAAIFVVAIQELPVLTSVLLASSAWSLASYELARTVLSRKHPAPGAIAVLDGSLLALCGLPVAAFLVWGEVTLDIALLSLVTASVIVGTLAVIWPVRDDSETVHGTLGTWLTSSSRLLRIGLLEWAVFAAVSVISLGIMATLGGADVVAGIRLGETLTAPIGIVASALPLVIASSLRDQPEGERGWPRLMTQVLVMMMIGTVVWLALILFGPREAVSLLVGDHVQIAREATMGLSLGVLASLFAATSTLYMKHRGLIVELRWLRWGQLGVSIPLVAVGASSGTVALTGVSISGYQVLGALAQAVLQRGSWRGQEPAPRSPKGGN